MAGDCIGVCAGVCVGVGLVCVLVCGLELECVCSSWCVDMCVYVGVGAGVSGWFEGRSSSRGCMALLLSPPPPRDPREAGLERMAEGTPLFDPTLYVYNSDEDPHEVVGWRVAAPFHAVKAKAESGEKWCVCWVTVHMHDGNYAGVLQGTSFTPYACYRGLRFTQCAPSLAFRLRVFNHMCVCRPHEYCSCVKLQHWFPCPCRHEGQVTKYDESRCLHIVRFDDGDTKEYVGAWQLCDPFAAARAYHRTCACVYMYASRFDLTGKRFRLLPDTPGTPATT
jgi:hypothetical protein